MKEKYLTAEETASILKIDTETMYRWLRKGIFPGIKIGKLWRIKVEDTELNPAKVTAK